MSVTSPAIGSRAQVFERPWLLNRDWDLTYITLSVVLVPVPYLIYLLLLQLDTQLQPLADTFGADMDSFSRNAVNFIVAIMVGGPHMYATFTRTAFDRDYVHKHPLLIYSSILIPVIVVTLAFLNLVLLMTLFFFWASLHVLHQMVYITELYNHRQQISVTRFSRLTDYGVIMTALYPLAAWKIAEGNFVIGTNDISAVVADMLGVIGLEPGNWMIVLAGGAFSVTLALWLGKSYQEYRKGVLHYPKTLFIALTVIASFLVPALGNLDTAFQGMNIWHSLQYLALTWILNNLRQKYGALDNSPFVKGMSEDGTARRFYLFHVGLTVANVALGIAIFYLLRYGLDKSFDFAFDRAYYIGVLSFLWIHYYHDHFLFIEPDIIEAYGH